MSVTAQQGIVGFGPQTASDAVATTWYRHRATLVDIDVADDVREGPPEVGGVAVPTFPYKAGPVVAGGFTIQPRLEDTFGWLLYALLGNIDTDLSYGDVYDHVFSLNADAGLVPWVSIRKHIPRKNNGAATDLGQVFEDCKILSATFAFPNDGPIACRIDALGRLFAFEDDPTAWTWANSQEDWHSIPVGCQTAGFLKFEGVELPVVAATVSMQNVPLDLRQERVYGSPYLEDITIVQRRMAFDFTCKWNDPDLYRKVIGGTAGATQWSGTPYTGSFSIKTVSSKLMDSETGPYSLQIDAAEVLLNQVGGVVLAGGQSIMTRFQGVALENTPYCEVTLHNKKSTYTWPT